MRNNRIRSFGRLRWRWWAYANCKDVPVEERDRIFFPIAHGQNLATVYAEAHEYCKKCVVKNLCKETAIDEDGRHQYGYRGDMTHVARKRLFYDRKHKGLITRTLKDGGDGLYVYSRKHKQPSEGKRHE